MEAQHHQDKTEKAEGKNTKKALNPVLFYLIIFLRL